MIPGFKLIDVEQLRIISPKTPCAYATLSYVWGQPQPEEDQGQKNVDDPSDLSKAILPATIQDAMAVCRNLGYRHLWVDRLCIDQDDDDNPHKLGQIAAMGAIYASSAITIVAASGDDARSGLAGVSRKRPPDHMTVAWGGGLVLEWTPPVPMLSHVLARGKWNTRGWTFQEWICASHAVFFTDSGVYGELAAADGVAKKQWAERARSDAPVFDSDESPRDYFEAVEKYTRRALTYPADVLSAFVGGKRLSDRLRMDFLALSVTLDLDDVMRTTASRLGIKVQKQPDGTFWPQVGGIQHLHEEIGREHGDGKIEDDFDDRGHVDGSEDFERLWEYHEAEVNFLNGNEDKDGTVAEKDNTKEKVRVARRLGIGQVYMKRWKDVERKFCSTVLE
ncbi:putative heterokaryon incompatibility [Diplodia seriata]|uniref:Putative heterokaryon incompatibility n=1 Tax=Diplodia seriata TaxID=420778 RepID=A0A0G2EWD2_9PEZI|nr:putative heterokaryon incompatibility [Diplodia seriata]